MSSYKLKIKLVDSEPSVTRTISVPKDITFRDLHRILQVAMGWSNYHLYEFEIKSDHTIIGPPGGSTFFNRRLDDRFVRLSDYEYRNFRYIYDMGDNWVHDIHFLKDTELEHPMVLQYTENCPPEDSGGTHGYAHKLMILSDPEHPRYEEVKEWCDHFSMEYDIDDVNAYLKDKWARFDDSKVLSREEFLGVCRAIEVCDGNDSYFDPSNREIVKLKAGEVARDGLLLINSSSAPAIIPLMDKFLKSNRQLFRKIGQNGNPRLRYRRFITIVEKNEKYYNEWNRFLDEEIWDLGAEWVERHGFEYADEEDGELLNPLQKMESTMSVFRAIIDSHKLKEERYLCPRCGTESVAKLDTKSDGSKLQGTTVYPAKLQCKNCKTTSILRNLNDGIYIGYHYGDHKHPCRMEEQALLSYMDAKNEKDPILAFDKCASVMTTLIRLEMYQEMDTLGSIMKSTQVDGDDVRMTIKEIEKSRYKDETPIVLDEGVLDSLPRDHAIRYVTSRERETEDFEEVKRLHSFARGLFDSWTDKDENYFMLAREELLAYTMYERPLDASAEFVSLLREATEFAIANPKDFDGMQWEIAFIFDLFVLRLWKLGFNDVIHEMVSIMDLYTKTEERDIPYAMVSLSDFKKGLVELTMNNNVDAAMDCFRNVMDIHRSLKDSGPITVYRSLISAMILHRYERISRKELLPILSVIPHLMDVGLMDDVDAIQSSSYALYSLMRDMSFEKANACLTDNTNLVISVDETKFLEGWREPMNLWNINICHMW